jgi:gephyrin
MNNTKLRAGILVISQTASADPSTDKCIPILKEAFQELGNDQWEVPVSEIVPDSLEEIQTFIRNRADTEGALNLIVTSGGTGFAIKDVTPEVRFVVSLTHVCGEMVG